MIFTLPKGILALDIDGTLTAETYHIPVAVQSSLQEWHQQGWAIIFMTGRPFQWSAKTLQALPFSYTLAVQNGAFLINMPSQQVISSQLLDLSILPALDLICQQARTGFAIYAGYEAGDWCYYLPHLFSADLLKYIERRNQKLGEKWQSLNTWDDLPVTHFASTKCFAKEAEALALSQQIVQSLQLHAPPNRDPFDKNYFVIQATRSTATKGHVLQEFKQLMQINHPVIAAGDDYNDQSMLQVADIRIVMANAPEEILKMATIVAPPATAEGLVQGLKEAKKYLNPRNL